MVEKVNLKTAAASIRACYAARLPLFMWGPPGVGKSAIARSVANEDGYDFIDLRLVQIDALDLRGMPRIKTDQHGNEVMHFVSTSSLPRSGKGYLFLDEFVQAPTLVMNAASELVLDRRIGEYNLPDGWSVIAAGNRRTDRAGTIEMPAHMKNRFVHIEVVPELEAWLEWAAGNDIHPQIIAYIRASGLTSLYKFNADALAFPTQRSWEFASKILHTKVSGPTQRALLSGAVGESEATSLLGWIKSQVQMPSYADVISAPMSVPIPKQSSQRMMFIDSIIRQAQIGDAAVLIEFFDRIGANSEMKAYIATKLMSDSTTFSKSKLVTAWAEEALKNL